jgi:Spy/CpxP family protein refolding chaperone
VSSDGGVFRPVTMNHRFFFSRPGALLIFLLCLVPFPAMAQGFKWWHSDRFKQELQLTDDQITRIEEVFQGSLPQFREHKRTLDHLEDELSRLIDTADEAGVMQQADRVEAERAALSKARTLMLVRIRRVLSVDQRAKLAQLHREWERNRKRDKGK